MNEDKFPAFAYFVKNYIPMEKKCSELMTAKLPKYPNKPLTKHRSYHTMEMNRKSKNIFQQQTRTNRALQWTLTQKLTDKTT